MIRGCIKRGQASIPKAATLHRPPTSRGVFMLLVTRHTVLHFLSTLCFRYPLLRSSTYSCDDATTNTKAEYVPGSRPRRMMTTTSSYFLTSPNNLDFASHFEEGADGTSGKRRLSGPHATWQPSDSRLHPPHPIDPALLRPVPGHGHEIGRISTPSHLEGVQPPRQNPQSP